VRKLADVVVDRWWQRLRAPSDLLNRLFGCSFGRQVCSYVGGSRVCASLRVSTRICSVWSIPLGRSAGHYESLGENQVLNACTDWIAARLALNPSLSPCGYYGRYWVPILLVCCRQSFLNAYIAPAHVQALLCSSVGHRCNFFAGCTRNERV
jgi:hypothetical protein